MATLRDQIAMSLECPTEKRSRRACGGQDEYDSYIIAEWEERYRLADRIIAECRTTKGGKLCSTSFDSPNTQPTPPT